MVATQSGAGAPAGAEWSEHPWVAEGRGRVRFGVGVTARAAEVDGPTRLGLARAVNDMFDAAGQMPIASDMGDCLFTAMEIAHTELVAPAYYATMGPGIPMGLGLQIASRRRPLILVGDGAFQMTGMELGNARRLGLNPIVLVFNNNAVTVAIDREDFTEFARVIAEAQKNLGRG